MKARRVDAHHVPRDHQYRVRGRPDIEGSGEQASARERRSRIGPDSLARGLDGFPALAFANEVLAPPLGYELAAGLHDRGRHARRRAVGVAVNDVGERLLHADVAREDEPRAHANPVRRLVDGAHEVLVRAQEARERADLRQIRYVVRAESGVEERGQHRSFVDHLELPLVRGFLHALADLVGDTVAELAVGALEWRDQHALLRELLRAERMQRGRQRHEDGKDGAPSERRMTANQRHSVQSPENGGRPLQRWRRVKPREIAGGPDVVNQTTNRRRT